MILLALSCLLLGGVIGAIVIIRVDEALLIYIEQRDDKLRAYKLRAGNKPKTTVPIILEADKMYLDDEKAERLQRMVGTTPEENEV